MTMRWLCYARTSQEAANHKGEMVLRFGSTNWVLQEFDGSSGQWIDIPTEFSPMGQPEPTEPAGFWRRFFSLT